MRQNRQQQSNHQAKNSIRPRAQPHTKVTHSFHSRQLAGLPRIRSNDRHCAVSYGFMELASSHVFYKCLSTTQNLRTLLRQAVQLANFFPVRVSGRGVCRPSLSNFTANPRLLKCLRFEPDFKAPHTLDSCMLQGLKYQGLSD